MKTQTTRRTNAGICLLFAALTLVLVGCGNHDQPSAGGGSGTMTPAQVKQNAQKQNQPLNPPTAAPALPGH